MSAVEIITEISLDVSCENRIPAIMAKQGDEGSRFLVITLYNNKVPLTIPSGSSIAINATREDGEKFTANGEVLQDGRVKVPLFDAMLTSPGTVKCDISVSDGSTSRLSTMDFAVRVEQTNAGTAPSEDERTYLVTTIVEEAEAYAVGTRGGVPVESGDPAYENNGKYFYEKTGAITPVGSWTRITNKASCAGDSDILVSVNKSQYKEFLILVYQTAAMSSNTAINVYLRNAEDTTKRTVIGVGAGALATTVGSGRTISIKIDILPDTYMTCRIEAGTNGGGSTNIGNTNWFACFNSTVYAYTTQIRASLPSGSTFPTGTTYSVYAK